MTQYLCGTCAWADHEDFYPPKLPSNRRLAYYARFFPMVEVDSTFYALQPQRNFAAWAAATAENFRFNVKAYGAMTRHHRQPRPGEEDVADLFRRFFTSLAPLEQAGKLRAVHYQFPPWFTRSDESTRWLEYCREMNGERLMAVEFRHRSWFTPDATPETLALLRRLQAVHVVVDEPQLGSGSIPAIPAVTDPRLSIIRFHGRNAQTWYKKVENTGQRFDYLYARSELQEMLPTISEVGTGAGEVHLLMNNNRSNYAVRNALDLMELLGQPVPPRTPDGIPTDIDGSVRQSTLF